MTTRTLYPKIGEVYQIKFDGCGSVQRGWRPGIIVQNDIGNRHSPNVIAIPLTSKMKSTSQVTHVYIPARESGLKVDSIALCENPETLSKDMVGKFITKIPDKYMSEVARSFLLSMPLLFFLNQEECINIWCKISDVVL